MVKKYTYCIYKIKTRNSRIGLPRALSTQAVPSSVSNAPVHTQTQSGQREHVPQQQNKPNVRQFYSVEVQPKIKV